MRTLEDIKECVRLEVDHFLQRHSGNPFAKCYLWYHATTAECDGGIGAFGENVEHPHDVTANKDLHWELVTPNGFRMCGADVAKNLFLDRTLARLPVLAIE